MKRTVSVASLQRGGSQAPTSSQVRPKNSNNSNNSNNSSSSSRAWRLFPAANSEEPSGVAIVARPASSSCYGEKVVGLGIIVAAMEKKEPSSIACLTRSTMPARVASDHQDVGRNSAEAKPLYSTPSFLRCCFLCNKDIAFGRDIYMYRGIQAFCSAECRNQQIFQDERLERRDKCSSAALRHKSRHTKQQRPAKVTATAAY